MKQQLKHSLIRYLLDSDATSIALHANNRKIWINLRDAFPSPYTLDDAKNFIRLSTSRKPQTVFAVSVADQAVGCIGIGLRQDVERISAEIGYWIGEPFWNKGIMSEAVAFLSGFAMEQFRLMRLYALPFEWNTASCHVLEKAGYQLEARLRKSAVKDGRIIDQFLYAMIRD